MAEEKTGVVTNPTTEDRILAAFAHFSSLLFVFGLPLTMIIWAIKRKNSPYVAFQSLQAAGYQFLFLFFWILWGFILPIFIIIGQVILLFLLRDHIELTLPLVIMLEFACIFAPMVVMGLLSLVGAVICLTGRNFRFPLYGDWLWSYLAPPLKGGAI